jgi:hypothetical protein
MGNIMDSIQLYLTFTKDLVTIISLIIAAVVAINGLHTWRNQLKGTAEYELAKRILKATYILRDALQAVRSPLIHHSETAHAIKEANLEIDPSDERYHVTSTAAVYNLRWKPVVEAYKALELESVEAEVLWGPKSRETTSTIRTSINSLSAALDLYLRDMQPQGPRMLDNVGRLRFERIIFSMFQTPDEDPYLNDLNAAVRKIEELARPHLAR